MHKKRSEWCKTLLLLLLIIPSTIMASPIRPDDSRPSSSSGSGSGDHHRKEFHERSAKWKNPCRLPINVVPTDTQVQTTSDEEIFNNIVTQVTKAENQAKEFLMQFHEEAFHHTVDSFKTYHYEWLDSITKKVNKNLNEEIEMETLSQLDISETIRSMYEGLQKYAVGLEQIVLDQAIHGGSYHQNFHEAEFQLKYVLCELQIALMEKNIPYEDVSREIMSQDIRDLDDSTTRNLRDWVIFRDYVNTLEYIKQAFGYFRQKSVGSSSPEIN